MMVLVVLSDDIIKKNILLKNKFKMILKMILFVYNNNKFIESFCIIVVMVYSC